MENIQQAILSAVESKPLDFKSHIEAELQSKISDAMQMRKQELASRIFNQQQEEDSEEMTDEEL